MECKDILLLMAGAFLAEWVFRMTQKEKGIMWLAIFIIILTLMAH